MKTKICILGIFAFVTLVVAAPHTWTLKTGAAFPGDFVSSGSQMVVIENSGTNYFLKITDLSTNDWLYFQECKAAQRQRQFDAEAAQLRADGKMEFTSDLIENFPEKVRLKNGWMDAEFLYFDSMGGRNNEMDLGFCVKDSQGKYFCHCCVSREIYGQNFLNDPSQIKPNPFVDVISNLKDGDKVRFFGNVDDPRTGAIDEWNVTYHFFVDRIEMIESAADSAAVKKVKQDLENSQWQDVFKK
jgi:hypothetical protein